jgi:hypothetical protein
MIFFPIRRSSAGGAYSARLAQSITIKNNNKKGNMSEEKKDKPQVEVRDLKPAKDAKGGRGGHGIGAAGRSKHNQH